MRFLLLSAWVPEGEGRYFFDISKRFGPIFGATGSSGFQAGSSDALFKRQYRLQARRVGALPWYVAEQFRQNCTRQLFHDVTMSFPEFVWER